MDLTGGLCTEARVRVVVPLLLLVDLTSAGVGVERCEQRGTDAGDSEDQLEVEEDADHDVSGPPVHADGEQDSQRGCDGRRHRCQHKVGGSLRTDGPSDLLTEVTGRGSRGESKQRKKSSQRIYSILFEVFKGLDRSKKFDVDTTLATSYCGIK